MEALRVSRRNDRWILGVLPSGTHFDSGARRSDDLSIFSGIAANIFLAILPNDIKPDNGVRAQPSMAPIPTCDM